MVDRLTIRLARPEEVDAVQGIYSARGVQGELGEFVMKEGIKNRIAENSKRGSVWVAELLLSGDPSLPREQLIVGAANISSRSSYRHLLRHGEVGVLPPFRRRRIGTAFYVAQCAQALMEGRRSVEDTIIEDNPNMLPFLGSLGYDVMGVLRERTRGFKSIHLFHHTTFDLLLLGVARLPTFVTILEVVESDATRRDYEENLSVYRRYRPEVAQKIIDSVETIRSSNFFRIVSA